MTAGCSARPAFEISRRLNAADPLDGDRLVTAALGEAASRGIVGVVDLDMAWNAEAWVRRRDAGFDATRIRFGIYPPQLERAIAEGLETGDALDPAGLIRVGALKIITDGSLGTRTAATARAYPGDPHNHGVLTVAPDALVELMTRATGAGLECACTRSAMSRTRTRSTRSPRPGDGHDRARPARRACRHPAVRPTRRLRERAARARDR
jgi:predicted amidohydrolase YtcJ